MIAEPVTALTDLLLALLGTWIGWRLRQSTLPVHWSRRLWAWGIVLQSTGALLGGSYHAFLPILTQGQSELLWQLTLLFLGAATSFLIAGIGFGVFPQKLARLCFILMGLKFLIYALFAVMVKCFLPALCDQGVSLLLVAALLFYGRKEIPVVAREIAIALVLTVIGGVIQYFHLGLHRNFNHNDIYHIFSAFAFWFFYRGGRLLTDVPQKEKMELR